MKYALFAILGLSIGSLSGILGIGGGVLMLPLLMWFFHLEYPQAAGVTLAILAVPVTLPGAINYYQRGIIGTEHLQMAGWIATSFAIGTYLGSKVYPIIPVSTLRVFFGLLMVFVAIRLITNSNSIFAIVSAAVASFAFVLTLYFGLRILGRRYLPRPELVDHIRAAQQQGRGDIEYHI